MLFVLTGNVQTGKTRWLEALLDDLRAGGVEVCGVVAPGVWRELPDGGFEKLGIDNVLLPQDERVLFARRQDLAEAEGSYDASSQSAQANLRWEMSEDALARVNGHLFDLASRTVLLDCLGDADAAGDGGEEEACPSLLVIDEVGRLELLRNGGLTAALDILDAGPSDAYDHALIIVREELLSLALDRFGPVWGSVRVVNPGEEGRRAIFGAFDL